MTWFKVDDQWLRHPKTQALSKDGKLLWLAGGLHCAAHLTDGVILKSSLRLICAEADVKPNTVIELVVVGLWHEEADRYIVHQWLDYQPSRESVESERAKARERMKNKRGGSGEVPPNVPPNNERCSPSPTRPDQTRPTTSRSRTTDDDRDGAESSSSSSDLDKVIQVLSRAALSRAKAKGKGIDDADGWLIGTRKNMRVETAERITELLDEGRTVPDVAAVLIGDASLTRWALRQEGLSHIEAAS